MGTGTKNVVNGFENPISVENGYATFPTLFDDKGGIKIEGARDVVQAMLHTMDSGNKVGFIPVGGKHDGVLTQQEFFRLIGTLQKEAGVEFPKEYKEEAKKVFKEFGPVKIDDVMKGFEEYMTKADKNKDGTVSINEMKADSAKLPTEVGAPAAALNNLMGR